MITLQRVLAASARVIHLVHPAAALPVVAIGAWAAAPALAAGDTNTVNLPAPIQTAANAVRPLLSGGTALYSDSTSNSAAGGYTIRPVVIPSPTVVMPGGGLGGGMSSGSAGGGNFGGGMSRSGAGGVISPGPAPLPHDKLSSTGAPNLSPPAHTFPPPAPHPVGPPVLRTTPLTPPVVVMPPRPPIVRPPVIVAAPFRIQPFGFGRPMVARPFVGGGGFMRHR